MSDTDTRDTVAVLLRERFGVEPTQAAGIQVYDRRDIDEAFDRLGGWEQERRGRSGSRLDGRIAPSQISHPVKRARTRRSGSST